MKYIFISYTYYHSYSISIGIYALLCFTLFLLLPLIDTPRYPRTTYYQRNAATVAQLVCTLTFVCPLKLRVG
ncbi:hypothetical protein D1T48_gp26 [Thermoproteus tenax virus 1]|uniref:Uncharacterized 8.3 kDa protein n=1 Tax=Thermoproteus tenax virus 1 (strain KRA1) TaxID=10480 RepID=YORN_TTV1K|nr:hypothetical protein D1T48_gp26 [Thermoproteus tenax virus 1]P19298.1 RecName: Full=Uncharacterized 8.3 kDa protein [Thermoproteus tenax virus 1 (STRAIN KRA1)]CAA32994.1 unnamed protein product [Thermoproteus tenax virus 1]